MVFDPTTIADANIDQINIASAKRPASDLTNQVVSPIIPATSSIYEDLQPADPSDDFTGTDGDAPKKNLWGSRSTYTMPDIQSNKLSLSKVLSDTVHQGTNSKFKISGDFDIQVDFDATGIPATASSGLQFYVNEPSGGDETSISRRYDGTNKYRFHTTTDGEIAAPTTSDTTGKFRMVRVGSVITGYYWNGSGWTSLGSTTAVVGDDVTVGLDLTSWGGLPACSGTFDNFTINSGTVIWPDSPKQLAILDKDDTQCPVEIDVWERGPEPVSAWTTDDVTLTAAEASDDFTGTDGDMPANWYELSNTSASGTSGISSNKLRLSIPVTSSDEAIEVASHFKLVGDFNIQIDYDEVSNDNPSSSYSYPCRFRITGDSSNSQFVTVRSSAGVQELQLRGTTTGTVTAGEFIGTGKFKFTRVGSTIKGWYWDGTAGQWEWDGNTAGYTLSESHTDDVYVSCLAAADFDSGATTDFDNFTVNSADSITMLVDRKEQIGGTITNMTQTAGGPFDNYLAGGDIDATARYADFGAGGVSFKAVSLWVKRGAITKHSEIIQSGSSNLLVRISTDGTYPNRLYFWDGSGGNYSDLTLPDTEWYRIMVVEGASNNSHWLWVNGVKASSALTSNFAGAFRYIGLSTTAATQESVSVTNIQVFDFIPTDAQIAMLYAAGAKRRLSTDSTRKAVHRYKPADVTGSTLPDDIGSTDGTITNMTKTAGATSVPGSGGYYLAGGDITSTIRNIDFGAGGISIKAASIWFQRTQTTNYEYILDHSDGTSGACVIKSSGAGNEIYFYDGAVNGTGFYISDTSWHHIIVVEGTDNDNHWVWVDGVKSATEINTGLNGIIRWIGKSSTGASTAMSNITNIQVFDFIPSDEDISELYRFGYILRTGNQYTANHAVLNTLLPSVPTVAPTYDALLCWDETQDDNDVRSAADASDSFTGTDGDAPDVRKWISTRDGVGDINSNKIRFDYTTATDSSFDTRYMLSGDFDIQVDFDLVTAAATNVNYAFLQVIDSHDGSSTNWGSIHIYYNASWNYASSASVAGGGTASTSDTDGKLKLVRTGSTLIGSYWNGSGWTALTTITGFPTVDLYVSLRGYTSSAQNYTLDFDNFTINSADSITGYVGDTGDTAAQAAYPTAWKARWGFNQDPSGGADSVLDSTSNEITLSPTNMGAANLVAGSIGQGHILNGTDEYLTTASESVLNLTDEITIVAKIKPSSLWDSADADYFFVLDRSTDAGNDSYNYYVDTSGHLIFGSQGGNVASTKASWAADTEFIIAGTYKATGLEGGLFVDGVAEVLTNDSFDTMAGVTGVTSVGRRGGTGDLYADMTIYELQVINAVLTADEIALVTDSLYDTLFEWSAYSSAASYPRLQYWDEAYADLLGANLQYWDSIYSILFPRTQYWDAIYGMLLTAYWNMPYGNNPIVKKYWDERYGDNPLVMKWFDMPYGDRTELLKYWDEHYNLNKGLLQYFDEIYGINSKEILQYFDLVYDIKDTNPVLAFFNEYYTIMSDSVVESSSLGFYIDGVAYDPFHVNFELNKDSFKITGEMQFTSPNAYLAASTGSVMRIVDTDIDLYLEVTIPTKRETTHETTYIIQAESKSRILEKAKVFTEEFTNTTAETIVTTIANRESISVDWQILDWPIKSWNVNDKTPYEAIHDITSAAGALIQSDFDGDIYVCKPMEANSNEWDTATPTYVLLDNLHFFSTNQSGEQKPGYNKYRASDQSDSSETVTTLEDDEYAVAQRIVKAFRVPWDGQALTLKTSDNNASILYLNIVEEELTEAISVVNGEGESKTQKPFYTYVSHSYNDTDLGTPTVTEEGLVQTPTSGQSLLTLTYKTKYYKWLVTDYDDPEIQVWVE